MTPTGDDLTRGEDDDEFVALAAAVMLRHHGGDALSRAAERGRARGGRRDAKPVWERICRKIEELSPRTLH